MNLTIEVGTPIEISAPGEGAFLVLSGESFSILGYVADPVPEEVDAWANGEIFYGVYIEHEIPCVVVQVGDAWTFFTAYNAFRDGEESRTAFFEGESNLVWLVLVEFPSNMVVAVRRIMFDSEVMASIREAGKQQPGKYADAAEVNSMAAAIKSRMGAEEMLRRVKIYCD